MAKRTPENEHLFCWVKTCNRQFTADRDDPPGFMSSGSCHTSAGGPGHSYCLDHADQCAMVVHDLPLAIQELHAYALLWAALAEGNRRRLINESSNRSTLLDDLTAARDRVQRLRKLEALLRGDDGAPA